MMKETPDKCSLYLGGQSVLRKGKQMFITGVAHK
jgi:hypothetical protein